MASTVESSHLPFGVPENEPSLASACWISEMRSGAGAFCPGSRRLECLLDFFKRDLLAAEAAGLAELRVALPVGLPAAFPGAFAGADGADHATPAVRSSARPAVIDVRSLIEASTICIATVFVAAYLYREDRDSTIELLLVFRWYDTRQEHRKGAVGIAAAQNLEDYVGSRL